jgi:hypothetical protein
LNKLHEAVSNSGIAVQFIVEIPVTGRPM